VPYSQKYNRYSRYEAWDFILPTGEQLNPSNPEGAVYYSPDQSVFVLRRLDVQRTRPSRVVTGYGRADSYGVSVGDRVSVFHDQTGAFLGDYELVGTRDFSTGQSVGEVPNRLIPHSVFK